jgi:ferric-dicitrate binding protein FerR (iron transport regulator)
MEDFIVKYFSGELSSDQKAEFFKQLSENPEAQKEFSQIQNSWALAGLSPLETDIADAEYYLADFNKKCQRKKLRILYIELSKYAAILVIGILITYGFINRSLPTAIETEYNQLSVPAGQRAQLKFNDGTTVWLNSLSTLTYPTTFAGNTREVTLDGEGYFDVTHNEKKAFIVKTKKLDIRVLGTEFNVKAYSGDPDSEVSLLRGSVELLPAGSSKIYKMKENEKVSILNDKALYTAENSVSNGEILKKEKDALQPEKLYVSQIKNFDYYEWINGLISFDDEPFDLMISRLSIYYDVKIVDQNNSFKQKRYTGKFRSKDGIEHVLKVLQLREKFKFEKKEETNTIIIK